MKKVLAVGLTPPEQEKLAVFCQQIGCDVSFIPRIGRPRGVYPVQNVMHAFRSGLGVRATAEKFRLSRRTVQRILEKEGLWPRNNQ